MPRPQFRWKSAAASAVAPGFAPAGGLARGRVRALALFGHWLDRFRDWTSEEIAARRPFLWLPVFLGVGVVLYFSAEGEPGWIAPALACLIFSGLAYLARARRVMLAICLAMAFTALGFLTATLRTLSLLAPRLERTLIVKVTGFVEQADFRPAGARLLLRPTGLEGLNASALPFRIRVTVRDRPKLQAGDFVTFRARLLPPPEPARPGGYDFGRDAFFRGIGGVGAVLGQIAPAQAPTAAAFDLRLWAAIDRARNILTDRIATIVGGQAGALAAALVTGKRDLLDERTNEDLRAAGIYHIVSVSGLHMVLAAGAIFWTIRLLLALVLGVATTFPTKKAAACGAMLGATAYCVFTGSEVATLRSLIMILVMLGAIIADRPVLSMRNLAIAAILVLLLQPDTIVGPSFQMSYAAVGGLIAYAEWARTRQPVEELAKGPGLALGWASHLARSFLLILATTIIASIATGPYAAYHFQRMNLLGLIGNALSLPIVSLVVMPSAAAGVVAYPFGLDRPIWTAMGYGVEPILIVAQWVAAMRGSVTALPAFGAGALALTSFGFVWFILWRSPLRFAACLPIALGALLAATPERPDLLVARTGAGVALRGPDGRLVMLGNPSRFDMEAWLRADGDLRAAADPSLRQGVACDPQGCVARLPDGRAVAVVREETAFAEDCRRAAIVVSALRAPPHCAPGRLIDRQVLERRGAVALFLGSNDTRLVAARPEDVARRPWEPRVIERLPDPAETPENTQPVQPPPATPRGRSRAPPPESRESAEDWEPGQ